MRIQLTAAVAVLAMAGSARAENLYMIGQSAFSAFAIDRDSIRYNGDNPTMTVVSVERQPIAFTLGNFALGSTKRHEFDCEGNRSRVIDQTWIGFDGRPIPVSSNPIVADGIEALNAVWVNFTPTSALGVAASFACTRGEIAGARHFDSLFGFISAYYRWLQPPLNAANTTLNPPFSTR